MKNNKVARGRFAFSERVDTFLRVVTSLLTAIYLLLGGVSASTAEYDEALEAQFTRFLAWWPGVYDNDAQATASPGSFDQLVLHIQAVTLPIFGDHVVYAEWQGAQDATGIPRQRFYTLEIDKERQALRLSLHIFPIDEEFKERTRGAYDDLSKIAGVTPADMLALSGCDVYFTWQDDHFAGAMEKGSCAVTAPGTTTDIYSWSRMRLSETTIAYLDGWFNTDGSVYRTFAEDWSVFIRRGAPTNFPEILLPR